MLWCCQPAAPVDIRAQAVNEYVDMWDVMVLSAGCSGGHTGAGCEWICRYVRCYGVVSRPLQWTYGRRLWMNMSICEMLWCCQPAAPVDILVQAVNEYVDMWDVMVLSAGRSSGHTGAGCEWICRYVRCYGVVSRLLRWTYGRRLWRQSLLTLRTSRYRCWAKMSLWLRWNDFLKPRSVLLLLVQLWVSKKSVAKRLL